VCTTRVCVVLVAGTVDMSEQPTLLLESECRQCGASVPYSGVGRPRVLCDSCRPASSFPPVTGRVAAERRITCAQCSTVVVVPAVGRVRRYCFACSPVGLAGRLLPAGTPIREIPDRDVVRLVRRHGERCAYCGAPWQHLDHVVPLERGGTHAIGNLLPACASCNTSKNRHLLAEWRRARARRAA